MISRALALPLLRASPGAQAVQDTERGGATISRHSYAVPDQLLGGALPRDRRELPKLRAYGCDTQLLTRQAGV